MHLTRRLLQRRGWHEKLTTSAANVNNSLSLSDLIEKYSRYSPSPISLKQFLEFAQKTGDENSSFRWLRQEIPTRLANMIKEMNRLPDDVLSTPSTSLVTSWYKTSFEEMMEYRSSPVAHVAIENFTQTLKGIVERHRNVVETMAHGIIEWSELVSRLEDNFSDTDKENIQYFLDRFYMSRIGIRLLINQHILLFGDSPTRRPDLYGSIDPECDVGAVVRDAYQNAKFLCEQYYLGAPDMTMEVKNCVNSYDPSVNIIYAPSHLYHVCFELFKNAMWATMERHPEHACNVPEVSVLVTKGDHDCCIRISDQGGGASREVRSLWFEYLFSTAPRPPRLSESRVAPLAGYGYGLPIARLYARYLGGDLQIQSMEGSGTDAYIYLRSLSSEAIETVPVFNSATTEQYKRSSLSGDWVLIPNPAVQSLSSEEIEAAPVFNSATTEQYKRSSLSGDLVLIPNPAVQSLSSEAIETAPVFNSATTEQYKRSSLSGDWVLIPNPAVQNKYKNLSHHAQVFRILKILASLTALCIAAISFRQANFDIAEPGSPEQDLSETQNDNPTLLDQTVPTTVESIPKEVASGQAENEISEQDLSEKLTEHLKLSEQVASSTVKTNASPGFFGTISNIFRRKHPVQQEREKRPSTSGVAAPKRRKKVTPSEEKATFTELSLPSSVSASDETPSAKEKLRAAGKEVQSAIVPRNQSQQLMLHSGEEHSTTQLVPGQNFKSPSSDKFEKMDGNLKRLQISEVQPGSNRFPSSDLDAPFEKACKRKAYKKQTITPAGGSIELYGCKIRFPPNAVGRKTDVEISVNNNPDIRPNSVLMISPVIGCKPEKFNVPVTVTLLTWFSAKNGERIQVFIMSKSEHHADWEKTAIKIPLSNKNMIEYRTLHFCGQGGAIEHEDAKKGYCHLLNDVWMHAKNARILSFFAKDMKTLEEARKDLSQVHSRILDTSHEVLCSVGNTVALKMEVNSPPALKITSLGEAEITITQLLSNRNRYSLYFQPTPHPEKLGVEEEYDVFYYARVVDNNNQDTEGGFSAPLDITWPLMHLQDATTSKAHASGPQKIIVSRPQAGSDIYIGGRKEHIDKSSKTLAVKRPPRKRLTMKDDTSSEED